MLPRKSERPVESLVRAGIPEELDGRHSDRGVDPGLDVAGLCRQLHRSPSPGIHSGGVAPVHGKECHRIARLGKHRTLGSPFEIAIASAAASSASARNPRHVRWVRAP